MPPDLQSEIRRGRPFESPAEEVYLNLLRTAGVLSQEAGRFLKERGLSEPQYNVLRILVGAGVGGLACQEIGERMVTPVPDVTRLIDRLEKAGFVERRRTDADRRVVRVVATAAGKRTSRTLGPKLVEILGRQLEHLSKKDLQSLNRLLVAARGDGSSRTRVKGISDA